MSKATANQRIVSPPKITKVTSIIIIVKEFIIERRMVSVTARLTTQWISPPCFFEFPGFCQRQLWCRGLRTKAWLKPQLQKESLFQRQKSDLKLRKPQLKPECRVLWLKLLKPQKLSF